VPALAEVASKLALEGLDEVELWLLDVAGCDSSGFDLSALDESERVRAARFRRDEDRDRFLAAHVLLRELLGARLGLAPADVEFVREPCPHCGGPHGRPAVGEPSPVQFSLSHSGRLVLAAIAPAQVGVDVERVPSGDTRSAVERLIHERERAELAAVPCSERDALFARLWVRKEAYLKGVGTGIAVGLESEYVGVGADDAPRGWAIADVPVLAGYTAAVALARPSAAS
jgi:4'-phosphopantetheinyl transferase